MGLIRDYIDAQFSDDETVEVGIGGFKTFARVRERIAKTRDIPVTYLEDGSHTNDHIIRNPLVLSIEGSVSDVFVQPSPSLEIIRNTQAALGNITQYIPERTQSQISRISGIANDIARVADTVDSAIDNSQRPASYFGTAGKTNIEIFIDTMESIYSSDALIVIDAPFRTYKNMAVTSLDYERDNTASSINFSIEFQQFRFNESIFVKSVAASKPSTANKGQQESVKDKGVQDGEKTNRSFFSFILGRE
jgi:hypothetical protein